MAVFDYLGQAILDINAFNVNFRSGDITKLRVDAIVHSTNENFTDRHPLSEELFKAAGPGLLDEIVEEVRGE